MPRDISKALARLAGDNVAENIDDAGVALPKVPDGQHEKAAGSRIVG